MPTDPPLEKYVGARLYYALGLAMTQWAHVEDSLLTVLWKLLGEPDFSMTSAMFFTPISDKARLDMVHHVTLIALKNSPLLGEWKKLYRRANDRRETRNLLGHLVSLHNQDPDKSILRPGLFDWAAVLKRQHKKDPSLPSFNVKQVMEISRSFGRLSQDLRDFAQKLPPSAKQPPELET
jgi:hypothetical protein